jgi:hypothetical protein
MLPAQERAAILGKFALPPQQRVHDAGYSQFRYATKDAQNWQIRPSTMAN